jgi:hypothetical protein
MADEIGAPDHESMGAKFGIMFLRSLMPDVTPPPIPLSIVYEPVESGCVQARIEGIPEVITAGPTREAARELVLDALREYLFSTRGNGDALDRERVDLTIAWG